MRSQRHACLIGGGVGARAAAAFMVRDGAMTGGNVTIPESQPVPGGGLEGCGPAEAGSPMRGDRMLTTDNCERTWALCRTVPSLADPAIRIIDETLAFNTPVPAHVQARLVDRNPAILDVTHTGLSMADRVELLKLTETAEDRLGDGRITDRLSPPFFQPKFRLIRQTTFAFQPWRSAVEFRRHPHRSIHEFSRIGTLAGVNRTIFDRNDSLVALLTAQGVRFQCEGMVADTALGDHAGKIAVTGLTVRHAGALRQVAVGPVDLVILQNASMVDASRGGALVIAPARLTKADSGGWTLRRKLADGRPEFGDPAAASASTASSAATTTVRLDRPSVRAPVLSTIGTSTEARRSSASASRISTPACAPRPVAILFDTGLVRPGAQGQAMIGTLAAATRA